MTPFALDLAVKGTILLILAFGTALLLRRSSAAARHLHWQLALAGLLALPLLAAVTPRLAVPAGPLAALLARDEAQTVSHSHATQPMRLAQQDPGRDARREPAQQTVKPSASEPAVRSPDAPPAAARSRTPERAASPPPIFTFHFALSPLQRVLLLWAAGAALVLALLGVGLLRAASLSRRATPVSDPAWLALLDRVRSELSLHRRVELRRVPSAIVPMTFGWRRPVVLLPADSDRWSVSRRRHVLLHELAHVRRGDWLGQIVAQAACAAWWWQPLSWIAARELRRHRELACDDAVLVAGNRASEYADDLLAIASSRTTGFSGGAATLAMARRSQLEGRLLAVLEGGRRRVGPTPRRVLAATAGTAALVAALACVQPKPDAPRPAEPAEPRPRITYTVTDSAGNPVPNAIVTTDAPVELTPAAPAAAPRAPIAAVAPQRHAAPAPPAPAAAPDAPEAALALPAREAPSVSLYMASPAFPRIRTMEMPDFEMSMPSFGSMHVDFGDSGDSTYIWTWNEGDDNWSVIMKGCVSPDETGTKVSEIEEGGSFMIEHQHGDANDQLQARSAQDEQDNDVVVWTGQYKGQEVSGEPARAAAEELLAQVLPQTSLWASERVNHLVATGGVAAALDAIRAMPANGARPDLLRCLVTEHELESEQLAAALEIAAQDNNGGAGLADLLSELGDDVLGDPDLVQPVFHAVETIESDAQQAEVLTHLLNDGSAEAPVLRQALLTAAKGLDSDAYAAEFLQSIPVGRLRDPGVRDAWLAVLDTIESDAYATEVLQSALGARGLKGDTLAALLDAATRGVDSDAYMAEILSAAPARTLSDEAPRKALVVALGTIQSDAYLAEVLEAQLSQASPAGVAALLPAATSGLDSDAYMVEVLESVPEAAVQDAAVKAAIEAALATIQSPSQRQEVREQLGLVKQA